MKGTIRFFDPWKMTRNKEGIHPGRLTWNLKMVVWFWWFFFPVQERVILRWTSRSFSGVWPGCGSESYHTFILTWFVFFWGGEESGVFRHYVNLNSYMWILGMAKLQITWKAQAHPNFSEDPTQSSIFLKLLWRWFWHRFFCRMVAECPQSCFLSLSRSQYA